MLSWSFHGVRLSKDIVLLKHPSPSSSPKVSQYINFRSEFILEDGATTKVKVSDDLGVDLSHHSPRALMNVLVQVSIVGKLDGDSRYK